MHTRRLSACIGRWRRPKRCVYFRIPQTTSHNRPGSTRMGDELRTQPRFQKLVEATA